MLCQVLLMSPITIQSIQRIQQTLHSTITIRIAIIPIGTTNTIQAAAPIVDTIRQTMTITVEQPLTVHSQVSLLKKASFHIQTYISLNSNWLNLLILASIQKLSKLNHFHYFRWFTLLFDINYQNNIDTLHRFRW